MSKGSARRREDFRRVRENWDLIDWRKDNRRAHGKEN